MKRQGVVINKAQAKEGKFIATWAAQGMNYAPSAELTATINKAKAIAGSKVKSQRFKDILDAVLWETGAFCTATTVSEALRRF